MSTIEALYEGAGESWVVARVAQRGAETFVEYTDDHLASEADLAPVRHPLQMKSRRFTGSSDEVLPGLLADALPDSWGRSVLRRDMRRHGVEQPTQLQMLTWLGDRTMGALVFRPVEGPPPGSGRLVDLDRVQDEALRHLRGKTPGDADAAALTMAAGASPGGARPKITAAFTPAGELVADHGELPPGSVPWLVKFHSTEDSESLSAIEATYLQMAAAAGITVCEHRLLRGSSGVQYLAVRRFDRRSAPDAPPRRVHMASAAGLLEAYPEHGQHLSYDQVIRMTRSVTGDQRDVTELVRRAVFNVVAHNRDDHARNIAYVWTPEDQWRLAPAYDLTHSLGPRPVFAPTAAGEHYLDVAGKGTDITRADLVGLHRPAGLKPAAVSEMVDEVLVAVARWPELAASNQVDDETITQLATSLPALAEGTGHQSLRPR